MKTKLDYFRTIAVLLISLTLCGCDWDCCTTPFTYTFRQDWSNVKKIEICAYEESTIYKKAGAITPLIQLTDAERDAFKNEIAELECLNQVMLDPPTDCGDLLFVISYIDGEKEMLGFENFSYITPDGSFYTRYQYFIDKAKLCEIFMKYADFEILSEISYDFRFWYNKLNEIS